MLISDNRIFFDQKNTPSILKDIISVNRDEYHFDSPADHDQTVGVASSSEELDQKLFKLQEDMLTKLYSFTDREVTLQIFGKTLSLGKSKLTSATASFSLSAFDNLKDRIRSLIEKEILEDGYTHPAEALLEELFRTDSIRSQEWILSILQKREWNAGTTASLVRLLAHQDDLNVDWKKRIVELGLDSDEIQIKDATVQAVESWEDSALLLLLERYFEHNRGSCMWFDNYVSRVIQDLQS